MTGKLILSGCLSAALCVSALWGPESQAQTSGSPAAYVYVSSRPANSSNYEIQAFSAGSDGRLTPVSGSPFAFDDSSLTINGSKLFGANRTAPNLDAYSIAADGSLAYLTSTDYAQFNPSDCGSVGALFSDPSGTNVYAMNYNGDCANNTYQSFAIHQTTGALKYLGTANGGAGSFDGAYQPLTFIGGDHFGYQATNNSCMYYSVWAFHRMNGLLSDSSASTTLPAPPSGYRIYIPAMTAADHLNHVAIAMMAANPPGCSADVHAQIGSFSADTNGNLTTTNTSATMPTTAIVNVYDMKVSPAGDLIAVAGAEGLQVLHFNGANPPTSFTGLVATDPISQMFWDKYGHLYAISQSAGLLHVFNATSSGVHEAPGSPYPVAAPDYLAVQLH